MGEDDLAMATAWKDLDARGGPYGECQLCGQHSSGVVAVNGRLVCNACWDAIERRPGRVVGAEIRDGLMAMKTEGENHE
jgi:hypothetical protein